MKESYGDGLGILEYVKKGAMWIYFTLKGLGTSADIQTLERTEVSCLAVGFG
jgi:hypothetical protein